MFSGKPRVEDRTKVMIRASMRDSGPKRDACVLDLSTRGLLATTAKPPKYGEFVELSVNGKTLVGHVKWSGERRFGITFQDRISVMSVINGTNEPVKLKAARLARAGNRGSVEVYTDSRQLGQMLQFGVLVLCAICAAFIISNMIDAAFGSLTILGD
ncbi:MAG: PilZ domain-containing protein [Erythrobacter sp.]